MTAIRRPRQFTLVPTNGRLQRNHVIPIRRGEGPESTPSELPAWVLTVRFHPLAPRSPRLPWGPVRVALLGPWPARWWPRYIAAELLREFRRQPAYLAELGQDLAQEPDVRRHRVAVGFDRVDQQVEEREGLLVGQIELHDVQRARSHQLSKVVIAAVQKMIPSAERATKAGAPS